MGEVKRGIANEGKRTKGKIALVQGGELSRTKDARGKQRGGGVRGKGKVCRQEEEEGRQGNRSAS